MKKILIFVVCILWPMVSMATPDLASISAGSVSISQNPSQTLIRQSTNRAILNWNHFDIPSDHHVMFQQPNAGSFTLNRVSSFFLPTFIDGRITANGSIAIINPQGIIISSTGNIQAGGFIASTHDILDNDVMDTDNILSFNFAPSLATTIAHHGKIEVGANGKMIIQAPRIEINGGIIKGDEALIALTTADFVTMDLSQGSNQLSLVLSGGDINIQNSSIINAGEGDVNVISGGMITTQNNLIQSSGGDINFESAFGDIYFNNNVVVSNGSRNNGDVNIETFAATPFALGSSENFTLSLQNDVSETGKGGDIVIRSAQIFGDQNCIQSGNITCQYQGQAIVFAPSSRQIKIQKQAVKARKNVEEKIITFSSDVKGSVSMNSESFLDIQIDNDLSDDE